jgi:hypothetical protein
MAVLGALAAAPEFARAQPQPPAASSPDLQRQYDAAFDEMLRQPANLDVLFKFATIATQTGDVNNNGNQFIANGTYQNVWNFGTRNGTATATFDGASFGGGKSPNTFGIQNSPVFSTSQPLPSNSGPARSLDLTGVFVSTPGGSASHQVGAFSVTGQNYQATGAFAGKK